MRMGVVVPTKDRPAELRRLLASLAAQTRLPDRVVIVDSGRHFPSSGLEFPKALAVDLLPFSPPSSARQRNAGVALLPGDIDIVTFSDDDMVLEADAVENMLGFWKSATADVLGASFNIVGVAPTLGARWKRSWLAAAAGIYDRRPGGVARSGWQTSFTTVDRDRDVEWLPSGCVCWRRAVLDRDLFDPYFEGYSYLEDLEHSYRVGRRGRLCVVADARCEHRGARAGRPAGFAFGRMEARNRAFFVRRHRLSLGLYALAMGMRATMTLASGLVERDARTMGRFAGSVWGMAEAVVGPSLRRVAEERARDAAKTGGAARDDVGCTTA